MVSGRVLFDEKAVQGTFEAMRRPNGAFVASVTPDYSAMWIRDHLYSTFAYWYLGEYEKLKQGVWLIFDLFRKYERKIKTRIAAPIEIVLKNGVLQADYLDLPGAILHAKYCPDTLEEITPNWGHDQLDPLGLFLYVVADLDFKNVRTIRDGRDVETLQLLVYYLRSVEYWHHPDFGMWEECRIRHGTSIGAVTRSLRYLQERFHAALEVPDLLVRKGEEASGSIFPLESPDRCRTQHHYHDRDVSQLSLIWPYNVIVDPKEAGELLGRIIEGQGTNGEKRPLLQTHGFNRYWGDDYYRSTEGKSKGISAEWPMFKFWVSVVFSQRHDYEKAAYWFGEGCKEIVDGKIPEAYQNGRPNDHTPLAWAHAIALIAFRKLPADLRKEFTE